MSNFKVKAIFLHQTDRMGHLGSILEIQKFWPEYLIPGSNYFRNSLVGQI